MYGLLVDACLEFETNCMFVGENKYCFLYLNSSPPSLQQYFFSISESYSSFPFYSNFCNHPRLRLRVRLTVVSNKFIISFVTFLILLLNTTIMSYNFYVYGINQQRSNIVCIKILHYSVNFH